MQERDPGPRRTARPHWGARFASRLRRPGAASGACPAGRPELIAELILVFLFILPPTLLAQFVLDSPGGPPVSFTTVAMTSIARDVALLGLVLFLVWRNGEPWSAIGWTRRRVGREILLGIGLFPLFVLVSAFVQRLLIAIGLPVAERLPAFLQATGGTAGTILALVLVLVVAVAEETVFRGYLMNRFLRLRGSLTLAVAASTLLFAIGHAYQGAVGVLTVTVAGALLALIYVWRSSLVAPTTIHVLQDLMAIVIVPWALRS